MDTFSLDDFDDPPPPPRYLYKYLSAERVGNVLEGGTVRFTPLLDTNDTFEVRSTFDKLAGPKILSMWPAAGFVDGNLSFSSSLLECDRA